MDRQQIISKMMQTLNTLADSSGISRCVLIYELYKLLEALRDNISQYEEAKQKQIDSLEKQLEELNVLIYGSEAETIHVDLDPRHTNVNESIPRLKEALMGTDSNEKNGE